jgi:YVTN family beta-propeller protein
MTSTGDPRRPLTLTSGTDGTLAYVTNESGNSVSVIDTDPTSATYNTVIATVPAGSYPWGVAVLPRPAHAISAGTRLLMNAPNRGRAGQPHGHIPGD